MKKIIIIGLTGSGKTTLAKQISRKFDIPIYYLDLMFWNKDGHLKDDEFTELQKEILVKDRWIIDGGFPKSKSLDLRIASADTIIFYDLPLLLVLWRQFKRYLKYWNKIRPDFGKKQPFPFTMKDLKYSINYPTGTIHEKIRINSKDKRIFIIESTTDELNLISKM